MTLHQQLAAAEAEVSRLRKEIAEAERGPRRWWLGLWNDGSLSIYTKEVVSGGVLKEAIPVIELRDGWSLVKDGPAKPFVATNAHVRTLRNHGDAYPWNARGLASRLSLIGIPAVAEGEGS